MSLGTLKPMPTATDLKSAGMWAEHSIERALSFARKQGHDVTLERLASTCNRTTLSTCFSGTGGAEVAAQAWAFERPSMASIGPRAPRVGLLLDAVPRHLA